MKSKSMNRLDFWKEKAPLLHISDPDYLNNQTLFEPDTALIDHIHHMMKTEGYFHLPEVKWNVDLNLMAKLTGEFCKTGVPTPFVFIYDEFWVLYLRLHKLISSILGEGYLRLPDFWAWFVDHRLEESGWRPHRDKNYESLFEDGMPKSITLWIPLTKSTPLNGCMYIVPADRDPTYGTPNDRQHQMSYPDIRALPAEPGDVFCWNQAVLHWGSHASSRASGPRVSVAMEFQSNQVAPMNQPLMQPLTIPGFQMRLKLIAKQILQYKHMYPLDPQMETTARELLSGEA